MNKEPELHKLRNVLKVLRELKVLKVHKLAKVRRVPVELKGHEMPKAHVSHEEHQVPKVLRWSRMP